MQIRDGFELVRVTNGLDAELLMWQCDRCLGVIPEPPSDDHLNMHGHGVCPLEPRRGHGVKPDSVPGGFWVENAWSEPRKFYSQRDYEKALDRDGMQLAPRWVPGHKHLSNWSTIDAQTLENARILTERAAQSRSRGSEPNQGLRTFQSSVRVVEGATHD